MRGSAAVVVGWSATVDPRSAVNSALDAVEAIVVPAPVRHMEKVLADLAFVGVCPTVEALAQIAVSADIETAAEQLSPCTRRGRRARLVRHGDRPSACCVTAAQRVAESQPTLGSGRAADHNSARHALASRHGMTGTRNRAWSLSALHLSLTPVGRGAVLAQLRADLADLEDATPGDRRDARVGTLVLRGRARHCGSPLQRCFARSGV